MLVSKPTYTLSLFTHSLLHHQIGWGLDNKNSLAYDYPDSLVERIGAANENFERIKKFPPNIRELIERTLHWIGMAISEIDPNVKVSFLSTALETLLTTKDDGRKGEKIAYRDYLLGQEVGSEDYYMPQEILAVYEKRSAVVHGSSISVASRKDYWLILDFAQATLKNFIEYVDEHKLTKPTQAFAKLLESEKVNPLLEWLEEAFDDEESKHIAQSLREDPEEEKGVTNYDLSYHIAHASAENIAIEAYPLSVLIYLLKVFRTNG